MAMMSFACRRAVLAALLVLPGAATAQDTRVVKEPARPFTCATLAAELTAVGDTTIAEGDEGKLDTKRIQQAIDGCSVGKAVVLQRAAGRSAFLTGPLQLKPGVTLVVDTGVVLFASRDARQYDVTPGACGRLRTEGGRGCRSLITAERANASGVMGPGAIDGRGWARLANDTVTWWEMAEQARDTKYAQNNFRLIQTSRSDDVTLYNLTLRNSPNFHVVLERGNGITAWGVTIRTPKGARNTDGIDPSGSQNVTITKSWIWTGDDNVAIKAGTNGGARNMTVSESHFYNGHGVSIGSETDGGASGILVRDVTFEGTDNALRIKSNGSRGGLVDGVTYENVCIKDVKYPIYMDSHYSASPEKDGANIPQYRNVVVRDVRILGKGTVMLDGYDASRPLEIVFDRVLADVPASIAVKGGNARLTRSANGTNLVVPAAVAAVSGPEGVAARTPALSACETRLVPFPGGAPKEITVRRLAKPGVSGPASAASVTYENPVLFADFSDPDVIRDGTDFWMTASSFGHVPGLPILHSTDLVHWSLVNHAIARFPARVFGAAFDTPQHGNGVWAPSIRKHDGWFWIYYGDPDRGIYMTKARDPRGTWSPPLLVQAGKGLIDPSPLWDDDGNAYLVHAYARSRAGIKHRLVVHGLRPDGTALLDSGVVVLLDSLHHPTAEGPKFYKRDGWYWILAPAGGVATGWQLALRSRSPRGPYEVRTVLSQGASPVNGPHQGAWVTLANDEHWFLHFQDRGPYGRIVHLQPMTWHTDGWPVIGRAAATDTVGTPVATWPLPKGLVPSAPLQTSDPFDGGVIGPQWQWQANPQPTWTQGDATAGTLVLRAQPLSAGGTNLWAAPNLLLQKFSAESFTMTARVGVQGGRAGEIAGLIVFGLHYHWLGVRRRAADYELVVATARDADRGTRDSVTVLATVRAADAAHLEWQATVSAGAQVRFAWRTRATASWQTVPGTFAAREGKWVGAKMGLYASTNRAGTDAGTLRLTIDDVRVTPRSAPRPAPSTP